MRPLLAVASLALLAPSASAQSFHVVECTIQCSSGAGGNQVFCSTVSIHENHWLEVRFSEPVDPASVSASSLALVNVATGMQPLGHRYVSPADPHVVVFEPAATFNGQGGLTFGFTANNSYEVFIPGTAQGDPGPFIRSVAGADNESRLRCTMFASLGLELVVRECSPSPNSVGPGARIDAAGFPSLVFGDLDLLVSGAPPQSFGIFAMGPQAGSGPAGEGELCISGPLQRLGVTQVDAQGDASLDLAFGAQPLAALLQPGDTWHFQFFHRDLAGGVPVIDTSDAIRVTFLP